MKATTAHDRDIVCRPLWRTKARWRTILFAIGDLLFLVAVGMVTTLVMHGMHQLGWNFAATCIVGMAAAMLVQMLMAFCAAPLLGSIETMIPSMVVGMVSPMSVCTLHMFGNNPDCMVALVVGGVFGAAMFVFVELYVAVVKRSFRRTYPIV
ncbi:MAG: hypothetical protein GDA67_15870 [Nitrospira sp. CR1.3]|nr:hypothetical protein [Nitrospira sp. CR1.3]